MAERYPGRRRILKDILVTFVSLKRLRDKGNFKGRILLGLTFPDGRGHHLTQKHWTEGGGAWASETSDSTPSDTPPPARPRPLILRKQFHQLERMGATLIQTTAKDELMCLEANILENSLP